VIVFFSDRLGCLGSALLSLGLTLLILALIFLL
jgi:hypothetical protein